MTWCQASLRSNGMSLQKPKITSATENLPAMPVSAKSSLKCQGGCDGRGYFVDWETDSYRVCLSCHGQGFHTPVMQVQKKEPTVQQVYAALRAYWGDDDWNYNWTRMKLAVEAALNAKGE